METPEEILSRIAYGVFGGVNATISVGGTLQATTSGGGNYSPPRQDDFPFGTDAQTKVVVAIQIVFVAFVLYRKNSSFVVCVEVVQLDGDDL